MIIKENSTVLFQGDSITDASRVRHDSADLGRGYAMMASSWFNAMHPEMNVNFLNRGISGDRVRNLKTRWQEDCIDLKPDVISIMIGINDTWRHFDSCGEFTPVEAYKRDYHEILKQIRDSTNAKIVLCEPYLLPFTKKQESEWRIDLNPKIEAVKELAAEFDTIFVPLDGVFAKAAEIRDKSFWLYDGVHPTPNGHALIAQHWLKAVGERVGD